MPLWPGGPKVGLGLWNSVPATLAVESTMFAAAVWLYARTTRPRDGIGRWALVGFLLFTVAIYFTSARGSPPPNERAIAWLGLASWILPFWAAWFDRHRDVAVPATHVA
jgi:hypothetical protein